MNPRSVCFRLARMTLCLAVGCLVLEVLVPRPHDHVAGFGFLIVSSVFSMALTWPRERL